MCAVGLAQSESGSSMSTNCNVAIGTKFNSSAGVPKLSQLEAPQNIYRLTEAPQALCAVVKPLPLPSF